MKIELLFIILLILITFYINYKLVTYQTQEYYNNVSVKRDLIGPANCIIDDIELTDSYFKCQMNRKYLPININVNVVKYQNFVPFLDKSSDSFNLLSTLTPSITPPPLLSDTDFTLVGTNTNQLTKDVTLNDYTKLMKVYSYTQDNLLLFDNLPNVKPTSSSLDDNSFTYLPDSVVTYMQYLNNMNLLASFIDVNKIDTLTNIANQFNLYLQGQLIPIIKPSTDKFRLFREIVVIYSYPDKKYVLNIRFNQIITWYDSNNEAHNNISIYNVNNKFDFLIIYPSKNIDSTSVNYIISKINMYASYLKSRNLITDALVSELLDKINNLEKDNILYVNFYYNTDPYDFGIELVKIIDGELIFIKYFDLKFADPNYPFSYYKNMCPDPAKNMTFNGRCYSDCPSGYSNMGLACILDSEKNNLFNPDGNYCKQVCNASELDIRNFDPVIQEACWCKSATCDKCGEFSIEKCNC